MDILNISLTEWVGYLASFAVLVSFLMKNIKKLRLVNMVGCALFVAYGFLLDISWPVVVTNAAIFGINGFYLFKQN